MKVREDALLALLDLDKEDQSLAQVLDRKIKSKEDQALFVELVKGVLSHRLTLDYYIDKVVKKPNKIHRPIREILRLSLYQWIYLDKIPKRALVYEGVDLAKKYGHRGTVGFVNGVLRNLTKTPLDPSTIKMDSWEEEVSIQESMPIDLVKYFKDLYGKDWTKAFVQASNTRPDLFLNSNPKQGSLVDIQEQLEGQGVKTKALEEVKTGLRVLEGNPLKTRLFQEGAFYIQDLAAMEVVDFAMKGFRDGPYKILDVCGAPGGKSIGASFLNPKAQITTCDVQESKLQRIKENLNRLGIKTIKPRLRDGRKLYREDKEGYDLVLVDAPCSGFGLLRRKPEIKYRRNLEDVKNLAKIQGEILSKSATCVKIGGSLVYSTCTLTKEENEGVLKDFLAQNKSFRLDEKKDLYPQDGRDGFKMFRLVKKI